MIPLKDRNPTHHLALVTIGLIVINVGVFAFVQQRSGVEVLTLPDGSSAQIDATARFNFEYAAIPCEIVENRPLDVAEVEATFAGDDAACIDTASPALFPNKRVWLAALFSMFFHADWFHLGGNMLFLWIFGNNIEDHVGPFMFVGFYLMAGVAALAAHVGLQTDSSVPLVGASGAVAGVMGAYLVWFPKARVKTLLFFLLIWIRDIKAAWLLGIWFVTQFFTGQESQVAWAAHVGGFVFGVAMAGLVRVSPPLCRLVWREPWRSGRNTASWDPTGAIRRF